jgi:hypothetical protein
LSKRRNSCKILVEKPEGRRLFGRTWGRKRITLNLILCRDGVGFGLYLTGSGKVPISVPGEKRKC